MSHAIQGACAAQLGGFRPEDPGLLVRLQERHGLGSTVAWHAHEEGRDIRAGGSDLLLLPQSFAALSRILARHVGLDVDGDNVPRWSWCFYGAWWLRVGAGNTPHTSRRWSRRPSGAARFAPVEGGSPVVPQDRAVVALERRAAFAAVFTWEARLARAVGAVTAEHGPPRESDVRGWTEEDVTELERMFRLEPWTVAVIGG